MKFFTPLILLFVVLPIDYARSDTGLNIFTGFASPSFSNSLNKERTMGAIVGLGLEKAVNDRFSCGAKIQYTNLQQDNKGILSDLDLPAETTLVNAKALQIISLAGVVKTGFPTKKNSPAQSYAYLSPKLNMWFDDDIVVEGSEDTFVREKSNQSIFALEAGIGLDIRLEETLLFVEVGLENNFHPSGNAIITPIRLGVIINL